MYQANVNISCTVFAEPSVEGAAVRWKRLQSQDQDMTIKAGHSEGHYSVELVHGVNEQCKAIQYMMLGDRIQNNIQNNAVQFSALKYIIERHNSYSSP